jgi:hypothetical protein
MSSSVGLTGSIQKLSLGSRTRWPLKLYPWGSENHGHVGIALTMTRMLRSIYLLALGQN